MIERAEPQWYRDAIIYQVHVKSFFDSNDDGIGEFDGLTSKLDYIRDLGVTAIWVMPFYPSPLRDDGYDISDYRDINPAYGTMRDFKRFVREAHERGLRVITELVINHTSDQHPWFKRAREAKAGSKARDFYVWSDTDKRYQDTRIIFLDTETSNWSWDPVAQAYFWHRFYSHQPDLNFDNPRVVEAVLDTMRFWLDMGVDGLRLDAIPYLVEREGTNCENLPETHSVIKQIRAALDAAYPDRMLLAEANQWPEETAPYFGDGDECHMAFHFPLMPRMYMAIAQEDRHPITDIMRQTPEIPEGCQWAIFLRNHDELTLEMVTDKERDYLWSFYAADRRARINLGIRRRLAPLLENDRRKVELMMGLLFSMPGTPVLYYGDEIGMGDNIYLGDRDGVRTPMHWSPDRNGGFSRADPARLFLPPVQDPIYGYAGLNVEAQLKSPGSLLNWTRRMIAVRKNRQAFGRGALRFFYPNNRKVLAYVREHGDERIVCAFNLSRAPQAVQLDLAEFKGLTPREMTGGTMFPPIGDLPYLLTLPAYGFYWFELIEAPISDAHFGPRPPPELFTLVLTGGDDSIFQGRELLAFERSVAPRFVGVQRWFAGKGRALEATGLRDVSVMVSTRRRAVLLAEVEAKLAGGGSQRYFMPLSMGDVADEDALLPYSLARVRRGREIGLLYDSAADPSFALELVKRMERGDVLKTSRGRSIRFSATRQFAELERTPDEAARRLGAEQSNTSLLIGESIVLKLYRRLQPGIHPEVEVGRFLTEVAGFPNTPALVGTVEIEEEDGSTTALAIAQRFVRNQGDAWTFALELLKRELETIALVPEDQASSATDAFESYLRYARILGLRTAEMHRAFATPTEDPAFAAEPLGKADVIATVEDARAMAERAFAALDRVGETRLSPAAAEEVGRLRARRADCFAAIDALAIDPVGAVKTRIHGDYHLGQVLVVQKDVVIVDFEGEPARSTEERRAKATPLRDVAGMLRSFAYVAEAAINEIAGRLPETAGRTRAAAAEWRRMAERAFLESYEEAARENAVFVADDKTRNALLRLSLFTKAFYEIDYEASNRPDWIAIPVGGVLAILADGDRP